ncbi:hypothetical protein Q8A73_002093 [Channa argus]|nr:hypothetical protein Q8A73_002093 [Channa argus]
MEPSVAQRSPNLYCIDRFTHMQRQREMERKRRQAVLNGSGAVIIRIKLLTKSTVKAPDNRTSPAEYRVSSSQGEVTTARERNTKVTWVPPPVLSLSRLIARVPGGEGARTGGVGGLCSLLLSLLSDPSGSSDSLHSGSPPLRHTEPALSPSCLSQPRSRRVEGFALHAQTAATLGRPRTNLPALVLLPHGPASLRRCCRRRRRVEGDPDLHSFSGQIEKPTKSPHDEEAEFRIAPTFLFVCICASSSVNSEQRRSGRSGTRKLRVQGDEQQSRADCSVLWSKRSAGSLLLLLPLVLGDFLGFLSGSEG